MIIECRLNDWIMRYVRPILQIGGVILFILLLAGGVWLEGGSRTVLLVSALLVMLCLSRENMAIAFLAQAFVTDSLFVVSSLSFGSLATIVFVVKCVILNKKSGIKMNEYLVVGGIIILQSFSLVIYDNEIINVVRFVLNLLVLLYFSHYSIQSLKIPIALPMMVSFVVLIGCLISLQRSTSFEYLGVMRYSGIWNDENFCGMYCVLGIISSIYAIYLCKRVWIVAVPSILAAVYVATLGMSRTFIFVVILISLYLVFSTLANKQSKPFVKIIMLCVVLVGVYFFLTRSAAFIISNRGLVSEGGGDWTSNRFHFAGQALDVFIHHPFAWFAGCGISNTVNFRLLENLEPMASHNSYVDLLVELGIPMFIFVMGGIVQFVVKAVRNVSILSYERLMSLVILLYMGTLTLGQYSILYIVLGMMLHEIRPNVKEKFARRRMLTY